MVSDVAAPSYSTLLLSSLELSDTNVYTPYILKFISSHDEVGVFGGDGGFHARLELLNLQPIQTLIPETLEPKPQNTAK